ncbi:DUF1127 domain-containing protein [Teichococcus deserti]|uniref:DUF1127 domain-containing protein n=1 Tax=Teichococcus deserti TaxID=1817963 RepID=UPI0009FAB61E|nr:DUF1127 domain-containing protein [Pseudoroseomonas deserti]
MDCLTKHQDTTPMLGAIFRIDRINMAPRAPLPRLWALLMRWQRRSASRAWLSELPPERLRDVGLTPHQAAVEAKKAFWE